MSISFLHQNDSPIERAHACVQQVRSPLQQAHPAGREEGEGDVGPSGTLGGRTHPPRIIHGEHGHVWRAAPAKAEARREALGASVCREVWAWTAVRLRGPR